jgi:hypothetical protein
MVSTEGALEAAGASETARASRISSTHSCLASRAQRKQNSELKICASKFRSPLPRKTARGPFWYRLGQS